MKRTTIKVTLTNHKEQLLTFTEHHNDNDYGNGNYISLERNGDSVYLDVRYIFPYVFMNVCFDYIKEYYGANHIGCEVII